MTVLEKHKLPKRLWLSSNLYKDKNNSRHIVSGLFMVMVFSIVLDLWFVYLVNTFGGIFRTRSLPKLIFVVSSALEALINYAYNGKIQLDTTNVQSVLVAACFLHLHIIKETCCDFLKNR